MAQESETIRWPTNLDRKAIEGRLLEVAAIASQMNLSEISTRFVNVGEMAAAEIGSNVIAALNWLFNRPEPQRAAYAQITKHLEMVALNLKNLK